MLLKQLNSRRHKYDDDNREALQLLGGQPLVQHVGKQHRAWQENEKQANESTGRYKYEHQSTLPTKHQKRHATK